jgi:hypothetical protein
MIKRHPNLFVKLFLIIVFVLLCLFIVSCAEEIATAGIYFGNSDAPASILIVPEPYQYITDQEDYSAKIKQWEEEYYYATKVWEYLRQKGFSQEITCAIIGNMMIETSGGSLDLDPTIYSPSGNFYGLCQWSQKYYPETRGLPFERQLDYLIESMPWEFNTFGWLYQDDFVYDTFITMTDVEEAALAFAMSYERCGSASYEMRQQAAVKAYNYFNLNK